ncbi:MerR family transcriptional regulator [Nonomuraea sp. NPDC050328]|uniref:MerR family transcriptional regulator n=1 Tax=Nonomuraea sp. NPDC050328 TaxID=3364361 RepID=UPI0037B233AE
MNHTSPPPETDLITPGEAASFAGVSARVIAGWTSSGLLAVACRTAGGHARYRQADVVEAKRLLAARSKPQTTLQRKVKHQQLPIPPHMQAIEFEDVTGGEVIRFAIGRQAHVGKVRRKTRRTVAVDLARGGEVLLLAGRFWALRTPMILRPDVQTTVKQRADLADQSHTITVEVLDWDSAREAHMPEHALERVVVERSHGRCGKIMSPEPALYECTIEQIAAAIAHTYGATYVPAGEGR